MKKQLIHITLCLTVLGFFACDMQFPDRILITGSPSLKFSADMEFNDFFTGMVDEGFTGSGLQVVDCVNTNLKTFIIYKELFEIHPFSIFVDNGFPAGINLNLTDKLPLGSETVTMALDGLTDGLGNFNFANVKSRLYISGTGIAQRLDIILEVDGDTHNFKDRNQSSGFNNDTWKNFTSYSQLPAGGVDIDLTDHLNGHSDFNIQYDISLPAGNYPGNLIASDMKIIAELVIWLPMDFIAGGEAEFNFDSDSFGNVGDFITSVTDMGVMNWLALEIGMSQNLFENANLVMKYGSDEIENKLSAKSLRFMIDRENMKKIESLGGSFNPDFSIRFGPGARLGIPRNLQTTTITLEAGISYTIEL